VFGALFVNGACRPVVKSKVPEPVNVTIVVFELPAQDKVTLGSCNDEVPLAMFQNNFVIDSRVLPSPLDAIKVFALTLVTLVSPVPSEIFVNLTAHADAWSFNVCEVTVSAILFFRYSFCKC
jgi:hypothetical protein